MHRPAVVLRDTTEWVELIDLKFARLCPQPEELGGCVDSFETSLPLIGIRIFTEMESSRSDRKDPSRMAESVAIWIEETDGKVLNRHVMSFTSFLKWFLDGKSYGRPIRPNGKRQGFAFNTGGECPKTSFQFAWVPAAGLLSGKEGDWIWSDSAGPGIPGKDDCLLELLELQWTESMRIGGVGCFGWLPAWRS